MYNVNKQLILRKFVPQKLQFALIQTFMVTFCYFLICKTILLKYISSQYMYTVTNQRIDSPVEMTSDDR